MKLIKSLVVALVISLALPTYAAAAPIKAGAVCKPSIKQIKSGGKTFVCKKSGTKYRWQIKSSKPAAPINPTTPIAPTNNLPIYTGGAGGSGERSFDLPISVLPPPANTNLRLWIYDPANRNQPLRTPGIWLQKSGDTWKWQPGGNSDGSFYLNVSPGKYLFDTVEPNGNERDYGRIKYSLNIDVSGNPTIVGLKPNAAGYFTVTLFQRNQVQQPFTPATACQLLDTGANVGMNVGFPKPKDRLKSKGEINALILPIDFATLPGSGSPAEVFYQMATEMDKYFKAMSNNQVSFNYKVLPSWHRANFDLASFKLGSWNSGDPAGYYLTALASADSVVDYSQFDVVYVLSPKQVPSSVIAYGPAFPSPHPSDDGTVFNGTFSGADAYRENSRFAWQWMAHETGHLFGIYDLYTIEPNANVYGDWDIMSNNWGNLLELNSWNRYIQGWLTDDQVKCLTIAQLTTPVEVTINPLNQRNTEVKAAVIKVSDTEVIVMEVRRNGGYDQISAANQGLLVYKVDLKVPSIKGGYQTQRRPGSAHPQFHDAPLRPGDKITVGNVKIEVVSTGVNGDVVRISN